MSMGKMSWEGQSAYKPVRSTWWQKVFDTDWAPDEQIQHSIGPMYLMFEDIRVFGCESLYKGFHKARDTFPRNRINC